MGKFSGVLLATDYDDTLYSSDCTISQENRQAIARFVAEGGLFCISTGRSYIHSNGAGAPAGEYPGDPVQRGLHL